MPIVQFPLYVTLSFGRVSAFFPNFSSIALIKFVTEFKAFLVSHI